MINVVDVISNRYTDNPQVNMRDYYFPLDTTKVFAGAIMCDMPNWANEYLVYAGSHLIGGGLIYNEFTETENKARVIYLNK